MEYFDESNQAEGGYIFLSHSHDDIKRVREIRNRLEKKGFEPLCFYLKCLTEKNEIEDLLKREIDAREWFVYVNSENARKSQWVKMEREYIERTDQKKIIKIDLDDEASVESAIAKIVHNLRVFMSFSSKDEYLARRIKDKLVEKDYCVFFAPDSIQQGKQYTEVVAGAIKDTSKDGCLMLLVTPAINKSLWVAKEVEYAISQRTFIIPIFFGDVELNSKLAFILHGIQSYKVSENPTDAEIEDVIEKIGQTIVRGT